MSNDSMKNGESQEEGGFKPVLGLSSEPIEFLARSGTVFDQPEPDPLIELTVIIPARNEEDCIGACLQSLVAQSEDAFQLGRDWELIVVDDGSTDRTAEIARSFNGVTVHNADIFQPGAKRGEAWTGKSNAIWTAARKARGRWLLFTDADTIHEPGNLHRGIHEAERHKAGMLSYSPRQIVTGIAQRALMPLIFSELSLAYPPAKVSDPNQRIAAANGQFLLVEREASVEPSRVWLCADEHKDVPDGELRSCARPSVTYSRAVQVTRRLAMQLRQLRINQDLDVLEHLDSVDQVARHRRLEPLASHDHRQTFDLRRKKYGCLAG